MNIVLGGIQPFTTIDYPEKLSAVFFLKGCPLRCPYCQNPVLQEISTESTLSWTVAEQFMQSRKKLLDAIVFSGGEPLIHTGLKEAMLEAKENGFLVGLHTSGVSYNALESVISIVDWIGFDVKTLFDKYEERIPHSNSKQVMKCLELILSTNKNFEARTTLDPRIISVDEVRILAKILSSLGVKTYAIQEYHSFPGEKNVPKKEDVIKYFNNDLLDDIKHLFEKFEVRRSI